MRATLSYQDLMSVPGPSTWGPHSEQFEVDDVEVFLAAELAAWLQDDVNHDLEPAPGDYSIIASRKDEGAIITVSCLDVPIRVFTVHALSEGFWKDLQGVKH